MGNAPVRGQFDDPLKTFNPFGAATLTEQRIAEFMMCLRYLRMLFDDLPQYRLRFLEFLLAIEGSGEKTLHS